MTDHEPPPTSPEMPRMQPQTGTAERTRSRRVHRPATDIYETDRGLVLSIDLPGVVPDAIEVTLEKDLLTIRAHTDDRPPPGYSLVHQEYEPGDFERSFTLAGPVDAGRIEARMSEGVLRLLLPKPQASEARRIQVRSG